MMDILGVTLTVIFFGLCVLYVHGLDSLWRKS